MNNDIETYIAEPEDAGKRLDKWLSGLSELSRTRLKALIESGAVNCDGAEVTDPSTKVISDAEYRVQIPEPEEALPQPEDIPLDIYFEDEHLLVVNKPAGMTVHPAPGSPNKTLVNALLFHARDSLSGIGGVLRPGIVHRIDKDTSGLLVVAKNDKAHQRLSEQFAKHSVNRTYICFVRGYPRPKSGRIESRLARSPQNRQKQAVVKDTWGDMMASEAGRHAITNYEFLKGFGQMPKSSVGTPQFSQIQCRLETGRTHQIRVHLAHLGCPLIGDPAYGKQRAFKTTKNKGELAVQEVLKNFKRQALHAHTLGFKHPITKEDLEFSSDLPPDMSELVSALSSLNDEPV